eukprot:248124-Chlamydomonas_euryale.AAC.1
MRGPSCLPPPIKPRTPHSKTRRQKKAAKQGGTTKLQNKTAQESCKTRRQNKAAKQGGRISRHKAAEDRGRTRLQYKAA